MDLKSTANPIDTAGAVKATLSNLFYGWGYNFYRKENQLRADDLLIRAKVSELLGQCREHLKRLEAAFRREHLAPPTREHPFADRSAVATVQALACLQSEIESLEVRIRNAPVPEMDRINQRHRNERDTLEKLAAVDLEVVAAVVTLHEAVLKLSDAANAATEVSRLLRESGMDTAWQRREQVLSILASAC
jgi:hypothetical protein